MRRLCVAVAAALLLASTAAALPTDGATARSVDDPEVVNAAQFALQELQKMSDTGIFETLRLGGILAASAREGVFHFNTFLRLRLTSPHLENGAPHTDHDVLVMRALEDGTRSFAIDDFPAMDPDAVEAFWNRMSDRQREERELAFAELEREGEAELAAADAQARGTWTPERAAAASTADLVTAAHTSGLGAAEEAAVREVLAARMDVEQERARLDGMKTRELRQLARSSAPDVPPEVRALAKVVLEARWQQLERRERDERQRGTASSSASSSASSAAAGRQRAKDEL